MNEYETVSKSVKIDIIDGLKDRLPQIFEDGKANLEKLKALLTGEIVEKEDDRFYFNWAGKSKLFKLIQEPGYGTLKPDKERSIDFDNTENIVIVGENLETLKLLLKPYFGKVKMIYIDPPYNTGPYNTGKDFIYRDNFKEPLKDYLEKTGQIDGDGSKLTTNTEASGRYHSDWLNFMYPRLFLARSLLRDDGVIFVSIDDNEIHSLRKIMDEIFGEDNFVANLVWNTEGHTDNQYHIKINHEYIMLYLRNNEYRADAIGYVIDPNTPEESNLWRGYAENSITKNGSGNPPSEVILPKGFPCKKIELILKPTEVSEEFFSEVLKRGYISRDITRKYSVSYPIRKDIMIVKNSVLKKDCRVFSGWANVNKLKKFIDKGLQPVEEKEGKYYFYLSENGVIYYRKEREKARNILSVLKNMGTTEQSRSMLERMGIVFEYPKPLELIKYLIQIGSKPNSIVLDFFTGSGTTGHAVWDLNREDLNREEGSNRKFILVNLDEGVPDEAIKKDFPTVADICIERLKRVSEKYRKEEQQKLINNDHDFGFKVFKLDKSNFNLKDEFEISEEEDVVELKKKYLEWLGLWLNEPLVGDWKPIDVVYEIMLKEGFDLNSKIEEMGIKGNKFFHVTDEEQELEFYMSLDKKITEEAIEEIRTPEYRDKAFVFQDKALTDNDKINLSAFVRLKVI
jgi:adenine-specific DNA-methyltransferase